jgi:hypothetical protein
MKNVENMHTASTQTALHWAPLKSSVQRASSSKFTSGLQFCVLHNFVIKTNNYVTTYSTFILRECICIIRVRASSFGTGSSIFLSNRPERSNAGSRTSTRFVAAITQNNIIVQTLKFFGNINILP